MEVSTSKSKRIISILIIIGVIIVAYFYVFHSGFTAKKEENKSSTINNNKINQDQSYIYFENIDSSGYADGIIYQDPIINIDTNEARELTKKLKEEVEIARKSLEMNEDIHDDDDETGAHDHMCETGITKATAKNFIAYESSGYATLTVFDYTYYCPNDGLYQNPSSYVFDTNTKKLLSFEEILARFNIKVSDINAAIREKLSDTIANNPDLEGFINIEGTITNLENNKTFMLYIDSYGKLRMNFVVITTGVNYNEDMEVS